MQYEKQILEKALLELASGNKEGLCTIFEALGRLIYSVALGITGSREDSEDVLQETMVELLRCAHTYKKGTNPRAFILTVARHNALDSVRKRREALSLDEAMTVMDDEISDVAPLAAELLSQLDVDGGLIGGASLKAEDFAAIIAAANQ